MEFKGTTIEMHAVTYAGIVFIQDSEFYEDSEKCNVLDADHVGIIEAEANGKLFSKSYEILELLNQFVNISDELSVPEHLIETFANLYANAFNTIQEATTI